jgi:hypothetical protein
VQAGTTEADITGVALRALEPPPHPVEVALVPAFFLDAAYRPRPSFIAREVCRLSAEEPARMLWGRPSNKIS